MSIDFKKEPLEKSKKKMGLTEREINILQFINEFGFCEIPQIMQRFSMKQSRCYMLMKILVRLGFLVHERIIHGRHGIYFVTQKGAQCTDLPAITRVSIGIYQHQLTIVNVYLKLRIKFPGVSWISERRLKQDKFANGVGKGGHLPDGILVFPDGKQIAIEVELTLKGRNRLERILRGYSAQFSIKEVWYYCVPSVVNVISELSSKMSFIKIYSLAEILL